MHLYGMLNCGVAQAMLEEKDYHRIDMVLPSICVFVDQATGYTEDGF